MNLRRLLFSLLILYTLTLLFIEWKFSQDVVRHFFSDIQGVVLHYNVQTPFYGINTSLSVFCLWSVALLFGVCLLCIDREKDRRAYIFYLSQVFIFAYLGMDDRLMVHEHLGNLLKVNDTYILLTVGFIEIGCLIGFGNVCQMPAKARRALYTAALLFAVMTVVDAKFPSHLLFRLSAEDLSKLWSDVYLVLFAWEILKYHLNELKSVK
ncbi:MAG: hypothetical protein BWK79_08415 [Beggiatoa sp. IS2]|nr:MAG: hypothetical protein BWK79_08415 [Beggiatoa sp. IS2]